MKNFTQKFIGLLVPLFPFSYFVSAQDIGDIYEGGYLFHINEDGTGLVADLQDLGEMNWNDALDAAENATSQGYDDWYLPNSAELGLMYNTIGQGGGNVGGFQNYAYWSSTATGTQGEGALNFHFTFGVSNHDGTYYSNKVRVIRSVTFGEDEITTSDNTSAVFLYLPEGWSMFGYTCLESQNMIAAFSSIKEEIVVVKDYLGNVYLPEWDFNGIGSLEFAMGYQIKMTQEVTNFQFCSTLLGVASQEELALTQQSLADLIEQMEEIVISYNEEDILNISEFVNSFLLDINNLLVSNELDLNTISELSESYLTPGITYLSDNSLITEEEVSLIYDILFSVAELLANQEDGITQADVDAAHAMYEGWCASDIDNDGICDVDEVSGCMEATSCNYVSAAEFDDGSCDYVSCLDECGVINGDNSNCLDCAGVANGTSEDLGCGCGNPAAQAGYDCEGNQILNLEIGQEYAGGIIFQINEDGTGLVVNQVNLEEMNWFDAMNTAENSTLGGYDDWFLPTTNQIHLINLSIGYDGNNSFWDGFYSGNGVYWTSTDFLVNDNVHLYDFGVFSGYYTSKFDSHLALFIRVFGNANVNFGCTNAESVNYNPQAVFEDFSCIVDNACPYYIFMEYSSNATNYDESQCITLIVEGCTDNNAINYDPEATLNNESCEFVYGCINPLAINYNEDAVIDDESCEFIYGCTDNNALNYNESAVFDDYSCDHIYGCTQQDAFNYNSSATSDDGSCIYYGCTNLVALNYSETANTDDGSCLIPGCINPTAENYNEIADVDDNSCLIYGCTVSVFPNYNPEATSGDGTCDMSSADVFGCMDSLFVQYNPLANSDNGSCYELHIGQLHAGGIIFKINEDGTGLVADLQDIGDMGFYNAYEFVSNSQGYNDWFVPGIFDLELMYNTIGQGSSYNVGNFVGSPYWSSSGVPQEVCDACEAYYFYNFIDGSSGWSWIWDQDYRIRAIRSF